MSCHFNLTTPITMEATKGLSVIFRSEEQYKQLQRFLGEDIAYIDWVPQMETTLTALVIWFETEDFFSIGSVGSAEYQKESGVRLVEFSDFFLLESSIEAINSQHFHYEKIRSALERIEKISKMSDSQYCLSIRDIASEALNDKK